MKKLITAAMAVIALSASPSTPARLIQTVPESQATVSNSPQHIRIDDVEGRNLQLLCREDFSKFTAGTEETPDSQDLCEGMYAVGYPVPIPTQYMSTP